MLLARDRVPHLSGWWHSLLASSHLPLLQLLEEGAANLEVWSPRIDIFERFHERPIKFLHEVDANDTASPTLPPNRVNQDTIEVACCLVDEVLDFYRHLVHVIEEKLAIVVQPVER